MPFEAGATDDDPEGWETAPPSGRDPVAPPQAVTVTAAAARTTKDRKVREDIGILFSSTFARQI